jgi:hypothetical protein
VSTRIIIALTILVSACTDELASDDSARPAQHCIATGSVQLTPDDPGTPPEPPRCFDTLAESMAVATNGAVQLSDDASFEDARSALAKAESSFALGTRVLAFEFVAPRWDQFWGTWIVTSSLPCSDTWAINVWTMAVGFNDTVSSAYIAPGCANAYHYERANMQGAWTLCRELSYDCYYNLSYLDDHVSSISFTNYF